MPADPKFAKLGNLSDIDIDALRGPKRCPHAASGATRAAAVVNAQKAATMSSWMKTLQSGANKVGRAPARQSNVAPGTRRRLDGVAATASSAARKGCLQQSHKLHTAICPAWGCYAACNMRATPSTSARRVCDAQTHLI